MKKIISLLLALIFIVPFAVSCESSKSDEITVVTTIFPPYDFARQITAGTNIKIKMLLSPGSESHDYDPTLEDIASIAESSLFVYVGGDTDRWVDNTLKSIGKDINTIKLLDVAEAKDEELVEGMEEDGEEEGTEADEHIWTSLRNASLIVDAITENLSVVCPENAAVFKSNAEKYKAALSELDKEFSDVTEASENKTLIFADRFPFRYFADDYGLEYYAAFPGCSSDTEPSLATVNFLVDKVKETGVNAVLTIEFSKGDTARKIAEETGVEVKELHSCHNVSSDDFKSGVTYLDLMKRNLEVIKSVL